MATSNFVIPDGVTVNRFLSKSGHDSLDGNTEITPKRTQIKSGLSGSTNLLGAGEYDLGTVSSGVNNPFVIYASGQVTIKLSKASGGSASFFGLTFKESDIQTASNRSMGWVDCVVTDSEIQTTQSNSGVSFTRSVVRNFPTPIVMLESKFTSQGSTLDDLTLVTTNFSSGSGSIVKNSDVSSSVILNTRIAPSNFRNNNFRGILRLPVIAGTQDYAVQASLVGTPQDNGYEAGVKWINEANLTADGYIGTIAGWDATLLSCKNEDPQQVSPALKQYDLLPGSPNIAAGENGVDNIGGGSVVVSVINTDHNANDTFVVPDSGIDTLLPTGYSVKDGFQEGTIGYIRKFFNQPYTIGVVKPISALTFDSDQAGGSVGNRDVPDAVPRANEYPARLLVTSTSVDNTIVNCDLHGLLAGTFVRINGEDREVTNVPDTDSFVVDSAFGITPTTGNEIVHGSAQQLARLRPNILTFLFRCSTQVNRPLVDSQWDNDLEPIYGKAGTYFVMEWGKKPTYVVDGNEVYGNGDVNRPSGFPAREIKLTWIEVIAVLTNVYAS